MITLYIATLDTRNFSFEAFGTTQTEARNALKAGCDRHAETYKIKSDFYDDEAIEVREAVIGAAYRDREAI